MGRVSSLVDDTHARHESDRAAAILHISEVFGPTYQGEGPSTGRPAAFVRLAGCNLHCAWCDSKFTWNWKQYDRDKEVTRMTVGEVAARLENRLSADRPAIVVVTGGEPLLQQHPLCALLDHLESRWPVEVETNGTVHPTTPLINRVDQFNVSPKLYHSGDPSEKRLYRPALEALRETGLAVWKFVCQVPADLVEVDGIVETLRLERERVWIMPEGTTEEQVARGLRLLWEPALERGYNLSSRLHITAWGARRGV